VSEQLCRVDPTARLAQGVRQVLRALLDFGQRIAGSKNFRPEAEAGGAGRKPAGNVRCRDPADGEHAELASLIRGNVVAQLQNLRAQPSVARAAVEGRLTVHGWYYDILTGRIEQYDEQQRRFSPLVG